MNQCTNCGATAKPGMSRCVKCGSMLPQQAPPPPPRQQQQQQQQPAYASPPPNPAMAGGPGGAPQYVVYQQMPAVSPKSKVVAALLCFFFGWLGMHNFYMGYTGRGVVQLLLGIGAACSAGLSWLVLGPWLLIEFIMILVGSIKASDGRPLS
ncbi:MAG: TM2 domain-containing protein [Phycisphaerae bacterium]